MSRLLPSLLLIVIGMITPGCPGNGAADIDPDGRPKGDSECREDELDDEEEDDGEPWWPVDVGDAEIDVAAYRIPPRPDYRGLPRKVLAFYYAWYGSPTGPGPKEPGRTVWRNWDLHVDRSITRIPVTKHYPAFDPYDSHDPAVIDQHCRWARQAGIDGWVISWWGEDRQLSEGGYEDLAMGKVFDGCRRNQLSACIHYESYVDPIEPQTVIEEIVSVLKRFGRHPAYLKVDGRPVVFVYARAIDTLGLLGWAEAARQINRAYEGGAVLIADQFSWPSARIFDGVYAYITAPELTERDPASVRLWANANYGNWVELAERTGRISTLTVVPGYDDRNVREPGFVVERHGGEMYRAQWEEAIKADPQWVLVTSFNEWREASQIEPSKEFGRRYLDITAEYARRFKQRPREPLRLPPLSVGDDEAAALREKLERVKIAVLPNAQSEAIWWLVNRLGVEPDLLGWNDVAAGKLQTGRYGILLYAGNEYYRQTCVEENDVDRAIGQYLASGGALITLPMKPIPFYYSQDRKEVNSAGKFGIAIKVDWSQPPEGVELHFEQPTHRLPHLPRRMRFPGFGEKVWRPFVQRQDPGYTTLLELRDDTGTRLGDAAVCAESPQGGLVLYAWFRLLDDPRADALLYDLFNFIVEKAEKEDKSNY